MRIKVEVSRAIWQSGFIEIGVTEHEVRKYFQDIFNNDGTPVLAESDRLDLHDHVEVYICEKLYDKVDKAAEEDKFEEETEEWNIDGVQEIE